ncbi:histone-like nucleoid-structuring protein Lsr2 [Streptomyces sp. NPDC058470]|uniref:Lsr2 family DNA-binding protein n=1 Tax=Streptomyces sp. NPDC058470 TaxID=3346515 RepID=UPI00365BA26E
MFTDWQRALEAESLPLNPSPAEELAAASRLVARNARDKDDLTELLGYLGTPTDNDTLTTLLPLIADNGDTHPMTETPQTPNAFEAMALSMHANGDGTGAITAATGLSEDELTELLAAHDQEATVTPEAVTETESPAETETLDADSLQALLAWADKQPAADVRNRAARIRSDWAELTQRRAAADDAQRVAEDRVAKLKAELEKAEEELRAVKAGTLPAPLAPVAPVATTATVTAAPTPIRSGMGSGRTPEELAAVRSWARANGHRVADKGMIAKKILDAYDAAQTLAAKAS